MAQKILFVTATRIGDAILSTGLLDYLARSNPEAKIAVACGSLAVEMFTRHPQVERVIPIVKRKFSSHWWSLWCEVAGQRWDIVVDLRRSVLPWLLWAGKRASVPKGRKGEHRVELLARTLSDEIIPAPNLWISDEDKSRATEILGNHSDILAVGPTANWIGKIWAEENFAALVARLISPGSRFENSSIFITGGPDEEKDIQLIRKRLPSDRLIVEMGLDLPTTAAVLARSRLFVGNDSGLMHMAAAVGAPTIGLFGPTAEDHYAPWGKLCRVVRTVETAAEITGAPGYNHLTTGSLMGSLTVDAVEAAVNDLMDQVEQSV